MSVRTVCVMNRTLIVAALISLITGIGVGYAFSYEKSLRLQSEISTLANDYDVLNTTFNQLRDDCDNLEIEYNRLMLDYERLNESFVELSQQYEDLLFHYNLINGPTSNFTTIQDLNITFTIHHTVYYYKDSVSGNITITYLNGTSFKGKFGIFVHPEFGGYGMTSYPSTPIDGSAEFYISPIDGFPPFRYGPGNYTIGITRLETMDGYMVVTGSWVAADSGWIWSLPHVRVEAK